MNKLVLSEKQLEERVGKQCELEFKRLTENLFKNISDKYEDMVKEQTRSEIDKVNNSIKEQCPEHGALVFVIDKNEIHVPFYPTSEVKITADDKSIELKFEDFKQDGIERVIDFINDKDLIKVNTITAREVEFYDKEAFENEGKVVKDIKHYYNNYVAYVDPADIKGIYLVNTELK